MRISRSCGLAIVGLVSGTCLGAVNTYHIGNSLTNDMLSGNLTGMSAQRGVEHNVGYHIRSSAFLAHTLANPDDLSVTPPAPYGNYANALPNYQWDAVAFQPYKGWPNGSTLSSDVQAISQLVNLTHTNPANSATRFYMYAAWPNITLSSADPLEYQTQWLRTTMQTPTEPTILARQYFVDLYEALSGSVKMIPAGEVLYALDLEMRAGEIPGFSGVAALYRDDYHMNDLGKHIAAYTAYATMFAETPVGLAYYGTTQVTPETLQLIQESVWQTVTSSPYTSVPEPSAIGLCLVVLAFGAGQRRRRTAQ